MLPYQVLFIYFETGSHFVVLAGLDLYVDEAGFELGDLPNFCFPSPRIKGVCHIWLFPPAPFEIGLFFQGRVCVYSPSYLGTHSVDEAGYSCIIGQT